MHTRKQYMSEEVSHRDYYGQFVKDWHVNLVSAMFGAEKLRSALEKDENLNNIPLQQWDIAGMRINTQELRGELKQCGDFLTACGLVCILKEAAMIACGKPLNV